MCALLQATELDFQLISIAWGESVSTYIIQGGEEGARRLGIIETVMAPALHELLQQLGLRHGQRCAEIGCGPGQVTLAMAALVGPTGAAVGIDMDPVKLAVARERAARRGLGHAEFRTANVRDWRESAIYDCVYARFLLSHLPDRLAILERMRNSLRPGGVLVVEDIDFEGVFSYPTNAAFTRYCTLYREVNRRTGGDADLGSKLYGHLVSAGLDDVKQRVVQPVHVANEEGKDLHLSTMKNIANAVLEERLIDAAELEATMAELSSFTSDPRSMLGWPRIFQVWGRRPAA